MDVYFPRKRFNMFALAGNLGHFFNVVPKLLVPLSLSLLELQLLTFDSRRYQHAEGVNCSHFTNLKILTLIFTEYDIFLHLNFLFNPIT